MKTLLYLSAFVAFNASALQPGEGFVREVTEISRAGDVQTGTITVTVRAIDEAADRIVYLQKEEIGRFPRENEVAASLSRSREVTRALEDLDAYCRENSGEVEDVTLPTGSTVRACRVATTVENGYAGYRWYAPVNFTNVVKESIKAEDGARTETILRAP